MTNSSQTISKADCNVFWTILLVALLIGVAAKYAVNTKHSESVLNFPASDLIGKSNDFLGFAKASYTLVVFSDYECPFCRALDKQSRQLLTTYPGKIRIEYRNLPLTTIHPNAMPAAILAETAYVQGNYWPVHDYLITEPLSQATLTYARIRFRLNSTNSERARAYIRQDESVATKLGLSQTPCIFLCCPDKRVIRLSNLDNVRNYV
jgi:protein-disulfide isomerase